ncbi:hypothetical protein EMIT07CA2_550063 [Brevibacillus sp. IT-7CA2]
MNINNLIYDNDNINNNGYVNKYIYDKENIYDNFFKNDYKYIFEKVIMIKYNNVSDNNINLFIDSINVYSYVNVHENIKDYN